MTPGEVLRIEKYLRKTFDMQAIEVKMRPKKEDSVEVFVKEEFVGVVYKDDEDGEVTYQFQMPILSSDLAE
jgi:hypothetical protein